MMKITGVIENIIFKSNDNCYTVFLVSTSETVFTLVGNITSINIGESIDATVEESFHDKYGRQYKVIDYKVFIPNDNLEAMSRFLKSLNVKGLGEATIKKIIDRFGNNTIDTIKNNSDDLLIIKGMSYEKVDNLKNKFIERENEIDVILKLEEYKLSPNLIEKIIEKYHNNALEIINENPYQLAIDIDGVGFNICDKIAKLIGFDKNSIKRVEACILYILDLEYTLGSTYIEKNRLIIKLNELILLDNNYNINDALYNLEINLKIKTTLLDNQCLIFKKNTYNIEKKLSELLYEKRESITIITGGPGTGKTYNINKYIEEAKDKGLKLALCAPTGRAAKRITEVTGYEAKTIHRLLECISDKGDKNNSVYFNYNEENKLNIDLLIVDEVSMVDEYLMYALIRAIPDYTMVLLVGDVDQLPSVGAGDVLKDMIESKLFDVKILDKIYRQGNGSNIVVNAHKINKGEIINLKDKSDDFIFTHRSNDTSIQDAVKILISKNIPNHFKIGLDQIQVICPSKIGACGTEALNKILQNTLNPEDIYKSEIKTSGFTIRLNDKVMQTSNNYNIPYDIVDNNKNIIDKGVGVYNGDIGEIVEIDEDEETAIVKYDDRLAYYIKEDIKDLSLAYAITVHKSQGSEYDVVIMPISNFPQKLMTRKILYTATTRAKKCIIYVGIEEFFYSMVNNNTENKRNTMLCSKLFIYDI